MLRSSTAGQGLGGGSCCGPRGIELVRNVVRKRAKSAWIWTRVRPLWWAVAGGVHTAGACCYTSLSGARSLSYVLPARATELPSLRLGPPLVDLQTHERTLADGRHQNQVRTSTPTFCPRRLRMWTEGELLHPPHEHKHTLRSLSLSVVSSPPLFTIFHQADRRKQSFPFCPGWRNCCWTETRWSTHVDSSVLLYNQGELLAALWFYVFTAFKGSVWRQHESKQICIVFHSTGADSLLWLQCLYSCVQIKTVHS